MKPWQETQTLILMNYQDVLNAPDEYPHGVVIVECRDYMKHETSSISLTHMQNGSYGLTLHTPEDNHVFVPDTNETIIDTYDLLFNAIAKGQYVWRGKAVPREDAAVRRMAKNINRIIDQYEMPDQIKTNNGSVALDDNMKQIMKGIFKQLMVDELATKLVK